MKILSDEIKKILEQKTEWDGGLIIPDNTDELVKQICQQVRELLDEIKNPWDIPHSRACPNGSHANRKHGFNEAIQTISIGVR